MKNAAAIFFLWLMFAGTHILGSGIPVRTGVIRRIGTLGYKAFYSLVALATFIPLCYFFFTHKHAGYHLYAAGPSRHPQNFAFALFGLAHLLANPYAGDWIFFGGFIVYGIVSAAHQDRRQRTAGPVQVKQFLADTSAIPFRAILAGKQRLALDEYNPPALVAAIVVFILLKLWHPMLFGGFGG